MAALGGAAQPLTVTADGAWIDLGATISGAALDVTLFYDSGDDAVTGTWCDAARLRRSARGQALPPDRLPQLRLGGLAASAPASSPTRSTPPAARKATAAPTCASTARSFTRMPGGGRQLPPQRRLRQRRQRLARGARWRSPPRARRTPVRPWPVALRAPLTAAVDRPRRGAGVARLGRARGRRRRRRRSLHARQGLAARVPAHLQRRRQQGDPARRRLAGGGARLRRRRPRGDVGVERRRRALDRRPRRRRSASRAT